MAVGYKTAHYLLANTNLVNLIVQDLARYVKSCYGNEEDVLSCERAIVIDNATNRAEAFADLLLHWIEKQRLEIKQAGTTRRKPALVEMEHAGHDGLIVPFAALERLTAQSSVPAPSLEQLYRVLEEASVLLDEDEDGPVCRREWFDERRRVSRVKRSGRLKVHG